MGGSVIIGHTALWCCGVAEVEHRSLGLPRGRRVVCRSQAVHVVRGEHYGVVLRQSSGARCWWVQQGWDQTCCRSCIATCWCVRAWLQGSTGLAHPAPGLRVALAVASARAIVSLADQRLVPLHVPVGSTRSSGGAAATDVVGGAWLSGRRPSWGTATSSNGDQSTKPFTPTLLLSEERLRRGLLVQRPPAHPQNQLSTASSTAQTRPHLPPARVHHAVATRHTPKIRPGRRRRPQQGRSAHWRSACCARRSRPTPRPNPPRWHACGNAWRACIAAYALHCIAILRSAPRGVHSGVAKRHCCVALGWLRGGAHRPDRSSMLHVRPSHCWTRILAQLNVA